MVPGESDRRGDHLPEPVEDGDQYLALGRPFAESLFGLALVSVGDRFGQLVVRRQRLGVEGMAWQVANQIEQEPPFAGPPEFTEVNASKRQVCLYRLAVPS